MIGLEYIRKLNNDTCESLAQKLNVTKSVVSHWESQRKDIPQKRISEIATLYSVKPEYITKELTRLEELTLQKDQLQREIDGAMLETDTGFECGISGAEDALRQIEADIKEETTIQGIRDYINRSDDSYNSIDDNISSKQSRIQIINVLISLFNSKETSDIFLMSVLRAIERSEDLTDEWGKSNPMGTAPTFTDKLINVMREYRIAQKQREEQEAKEFIDLFGSPDDNDSK